MITKKDVPLTIYDTKGLELGRDTQKQIKAEIIDKIKEGLYSKDENKCIHCIWYCINTVSDRIEEDEIEWIKDFTEENRETQVPIIIVLTKSFSKVKAREFKSYIDSLNLNVCAIVPVLALDYEIDEDYVAKAYGGEELIEIMGELLGDELIPTLQNVQKAAIKQKIKYARGIVATTVTASFAQGFVPVPFADAALLVPTQVTMIASITVAFGLKVDRSIITAFISTILGTTGATIAGRTIVANLFKLLPGVGTVVGGMITGGTAAVVTTALGEAYIRLLEKMCLGEIKSGDLGSKEVRKEMRSIFKEEIR